MAHVISRTSMSYSYASTSRAFSTSPPALGKSPPGKGKNAAKRARREERIARAAASGESLRPKAQPMNLEDATRIFQAVEVTRPLNAYELHVVTTVSSHQANALRGQLALPRESRTRSERFLIFAEDDSAVSRAVDSLKESSPLLKDNIVMGGSEMIQDVVAGKGAAGGEFTKVLSTPGLLPQVSRALARSLGPKGLMPNVKRGTVVVTPDEMNKAIREAQGAITWRGDRSGVIRGGMSTLVTGMPHALLTISFQLSGGSISPHQSCVQIFQLTCKQSLIKSAVAWPVDQHLLVSLQPLANQEKLLRRRLREVRCLCTSFFWQRYKC